MVNCTSLSFKRFFSHVKAHQDDYLDFDEMEPEAQLNSGCDYAAKQCIVTSVTQEIPQQQAFPLEPASIFIDGHKITMESGGR